MSDNDTTGQHRIRPLDTPLSEADTLKTVDARTTTLEPTSQEEQDTIALLSAGFTLSSDNNPCSDESSLDPELLSLLTR